EVSISPLFRWPNSVCHFINIIGGVKGIRDLIDGYALKAIKENYPQWEAVGIQLLSKCVRGNELTQSGKEIWQSMVNDMSDTVMGNM
ncbi:hypothetical protein UL76_23050, partial [Shigella dysenteriae]